MSDYNDNIITDYLKYGFPVGYAAQCIPVSSYVNHKGAYDYPRDIEIHIIKEIELNATIGPFYTSPFQSPIFISPLNTVPKKGSELRRVIMDMSFSPVFSVNDGIPTHSYLDYQFKVTYPKIDDLIALIWKFGPGCHLFKRDLARAYRQLVIDPVDYPLLGFSWRGELFFDVVPPFGMRSSAMMCQRLTNAINYIMQNLNYHTINYLDDFGGADEPQKADKAFETLGRLLENLKIDESNEKACKPNTSMVFLGTLFDTVDMTISVPEEKINEIMNLLPIWMHKQTISKKQLQSIIGKLQYIAHCVRPGRIFISRLLQLLREFKSSQKRIKFTSDYKKDLKWWYTFLKEYNGISMIPHLQWSKPDVVLETDACLTGCGAISQGECFHTTFPKFILNHVHNINTLELLTITIACKIWGTQFRGKRILVYCDNNTSVQVLNSGKSKDEALLKCLREICYFSAMHEFEIRAEHLPGVENRKSDLLSRWHLDGKYKRLFEAEFNNLNLKIVDVSKDNFKFSHKW